jgi:2-polyprenyl-3-methyl-5-hydroxy-6-metoxy-1,4-benzoquinol methylase
VELRLFSAYINGVKQAVKMSPEKSSAKKESLELVKVNRCICGSDDAAVAGVGEDFEYRTSPDVFVAMQCDNCGLVYLNPRPSVSEFERIYPPSYHAFDFSEKDFGFVFKVRSRLEANRLLTHCQGLPDDGRILDVGCGDGFHLRLLRDFGNQNWTVEGLDASEKAVEAAIKSGIKAHFGTAENNDLPADSYDLAFLIQTIEHVEKPDQVLPAICRVLKPGGKLIIVTDNTDSLDFKLFKNGYWGGYHFPRHWNLFNRHALTQLAEKSGFAVDEMTTIVSPVNWVYSIHNALVDADAPRFLINQFTLKSTISLGVFTILDMILQKLGRGALLRATLRKK